MYLRKNYYEGSSEWKQFRTDVKGITIFTNEVLEGYHVIYVYGRSTKVTKHNYFLDEQSLLLDIDNRVSNVSKKNFIKEQAKQAKKKDAVINRAKVQVNDLFYTSWGYDQTNVYFFQVTKRLSPAKVQITPICGSLEDTGHMCGQITPIPGSFCGSSKSCLIDSYGNICSADDYNNKAYPTEKGKSHYKSWYG